MEQYLNCLGIVDDATKLNYGTMNLKGRAQKWMKSLAVLRKKPQTWNDFKTAIIAQYQDPNVADTARLRLEKLRQVGSVIVYNEKFLDLMVDIGDSMSEFDQVWNYKKGLKPQQHMQVDLQKPKSLAEAMELAVKVDNSIWSSRQVQLQYGHNKQGNSAIPMELDTISHKFGSNKMNKQNQNYKTISNVDGKELARRKQEGLCLRCGKSGHRIATCTNFQ